MTSQHKTIFMTSQHNTGTHPFYIGMYIHIYTHICTYMYTSQKECLLYVFFTKTPPWLFVLLTIHPKLSCSNGMHLERKGTVPRGKFNQKISPNASATRRRSAVLLVPCKYIQHIQRDLGCVMEQAKHLAFFNVPVSKTTKFDLWKSEYSVHTCSAKAKCTEHTKRTKPGLRKNLRHNPSGWVWFVHTHPKMVGFQETYQHYQS